MRKITLGKTNITVNKNGFGALPIQRISDKDAVYLLHKAFDNGIDFYDTARYYTDSEEKLGMAFQDRRDKIFLASKTGAENAEDFWKDLETTLRNLKTDYLDIYQFHNTPFCPKPGDGSGLYEAMEKAKEQGKIRHIAITNHRLAVAREAVESGLYDTLQFPFSYLSSDQELDLVKKCKAADMGFIAMKALAGGLINHSAAAYAYMLQFDNVLPIWGIQRETELDEFLSYQENEPVLDGELSAVIRRDPDPLQGELCRGSGYCLPGPAGIEINTCARMSLLIRRAPSEEQLTEKAQAMMKKTEDCLHCNACSRKCPYGLDTPALLERTYQDYKEILAGKEYE